MQEFAFSECSPWGRCLTQFLKTRQQYTNILAYFLSHPAKMPDLYTQEDVYRYLSLPCRGQRNKGGIPSIATSNQRLAILKSFYSFATTYVVSVNGHPEPLLKTIPPTLGLKAGKSRGQASVFSFEELQQLFAIIPSDVRGLRAKAIFSLFFWSCRRRSEIANLRIGDIERATIIDDRGERREGHIYWFQNKGDVNKDSSELPPPAKNAIDRYLVASGRMASLCPDDPLFTRLHQRKDVEPHQPLNDEAFAREMQYWCKKAGIEKHVTIHSFRHTGARARYEAGSGIREIQKLLRHSSLQTTDIY